MYHICTTEKSAQQQRQLEIALLSSMGEQLYDNISVSALCQKAGLSRKTFYRLFSEKNDVLCALIDHTLMDYENRRSTFHTFENDLIYFCTFWREQSALLSALSKNNASGIMIERFVSHVYREHKQILLYLEPGERMDARDVLLFNTCGIVGLLIDWHMSGYKKSVEQMAQLIQNLLTTPLIR